MEDNKITLKEFWNSKEKLAIHCDTEEKANKLLKAFDKLGKEWRSGNSYLELNCWNSYQKDICYNNDNGYSSINWCKENNCIIYEFEDVIEVHDILIEKERRYLSNIIRPFRDRVIYIKKVKSGYNGAYFISIHTKSKYIPEGESLCFPFFKNEMYVGMKENEEYTLEELGL